MQPKRALLAVDEQLQSEREIISSRLPAPPQWRGDQPLWARVVAHARLYAACRPVSFQRADDDEVFARLFNDLAQAAALIGRGVTLYELKRWLDEPHVRVLPDAKHVLNLVRIIDSLDLF